MVVIHNKINEKNEKTERRNNPTIMKYNMNEINEKANYCLSCKTKMCMKGCPLENDITEFIKKVKEKEYEEAYRVLCKTTVLQPLCGRVCPHKSQCEGACVRGIKGESVHIGDLEAFVGDMAIENGYEIEKFTNEKKDKKVGIIGGGPAGITAAANLARNGYNVTIFEKYDKLGGILRHGIPKFRLDEKVLDNQIEKILKLGIQVKYNSILGKDFTLEELQDNFDAIFLAFGANISSKMNIEGEELDGVYGGNELLEYGNHPDYTNKNVAVIGGGNVAMDASRTIKRLGAKSVKVIYRRSEKWMPAERKEIEDAKKEGVEFLFQNNIVKIIGNEKVEKIECIKTELVKKEGEAREVPVDIEGSNYIMDMDYVVMAVGSKTEKELVESLGVELTKRGNIQVNEKYMTSKNGVFAGGDLSGTKATVAWASRSGREASNNIIEFLQNA